MRNSIRDLFVYFALIIINLYGLIDKIDAQQKSESDHTAIINRYLTVPDIHNEIHYYKLGTPLSVSREVYFSPEVKASNIFNLPLIQSETVEFENIFTGDVRRGGSCNVDLLRYVPHSLTHLETAAHLLNPDNNPTTIIDLPVSELSGLVYLMDLTYLSIEPGSLIHWEDIQSKLKQNTLPVSMLALKTRSSLLPQDYDFSGKDYPALSPETAREIHDYSLNFSSIKTRIDCLILDLPSIDPERDGGRLLAHRNFFGLSDTGHNETGKEKRSLIELAYFPDCKEGYYYAVITPPRFQTNAVSTGITFWSLAETQLK